MKNKAKHSAHLVSHLVFNPQLTLVGNVSPNDSERDSVPGEEISISVTFIFQLKTLAISAPFLSLGQKNVSGTLGGGMELNRQ